MPKIQKKTKSSNVLKFSFTETLSMGLSQVNKYRKIPKISLSMYKPL